MEHLQINLFPTPQSGRPGIRSHRARPELARQTRYQPMVAVPGELPSDQWRYGFELKWNGLRTITYLEDRNLTLQTGQVENALERYPELLGLLEMVENRRLVLDGEIVAAGVDGRPDPAQLRTRSELIDKGHLWRAVEEIPVTYIIFDVLNIDGRDTTGLPYHHRRELLEGLELIGSNWDTPPYLEEEGSALIQACRHRRLDGVMAKRIDSVYEAGKRSRSWLKIRIRPRQKFLVCGVLPQAGDPATAESLLLGVYDLTPEQAAQRGRPQRLLYAGKMQVGDSPAEQTMLRERLSGLQRTTSPFEDVAALPDRGPMFMEPLVTCEAEFADWTPLGVVRQASLKNFVPGAQPQTVVRES